MTPDLNPALYTYHLPESRIAVQPLENRSASRLLVFRHGTLTDDRFYNVINYLNPGDLLCLNDSKVVNARLFMFRDSGAEIELLLLNPAKGLDPQLALSSKSFSDWECMVGGKKKWKEGESLKIEQPGVPYLEAHWLDRDQNQVHFSWEQDLSFGELLSNLGHVPLPPYLKREDMALDKERYQTIFARNDGAVAAPTAGLHFDQKLLKDLKSKKIDLSYLTLHVGGGTFAPLKASRIEDHLMHKERISVSREFIESLIGTEGRVFAVGTTSLRTLESLYWFAVMVKKDPKAEFDLGQFYCYKNHGKLPSGKEALLDLLNWMEKHKVERLHGETSLFIVPGYTFRICQGLFTNFHLPGSTLLLLVAAFVGSSWKSLYEHALESGYRFLSYGDTSLLFPS